MRADTPRKGSTSMTPDERRLRRKLSWPVLLTVRLPRKEFVANLRASRVEFVLSSQWGAGHVARIVIYNDGTEPN